MQDYRFFFQNMYFDPPEYVDFSNIKWHNIIIYANYEHPTPRGTTIMAAELHEMYTKLID